MDERAVLNCQIASWYSDFERVTYRTRLIELPDAFVEYLLEDGVYLPEESAALPARHKPDEHSDYQDWAEEDTEPPEAEGADGKVPAFPELFAQIDAAIAALGGRVLPKLNWSAPLDTAWLTTTGSIACTNADEVVLLLKSSDRIAHDLCHAFDGCASRRERPPCACLALRKFYDLRPGREFRCFMRNHELVAVSQRSIGEHYPHLAAERGALLEALLEFAEEHLERFLEPDVAADVYVAASGRVRLVDFNPIGGSTSPLLFDWDELPYGCSTSAAATSAAATPAQAPGACGAPLPGTGSASGVDIGPDAGHAHAGAAPAANCASRADDESCGEAPVAQALAGACNGGVQGPGARAGADAAPSHPAGPTRGSEGSGDGSVVAEAPVSGGGGGRGARDEAVTGGEVMFRVVTEPAGLRPGAAACRAPFDFADTGPGGAMDALLRKLQVETQ